MVDVEDDLLGLLQTGSSRRPQPEAGIDGVNSREQLGTEAADE